MDSEQDVRFRLFQDPWELFDQHDAQEAVQVAQQALTLAEEILQDMAKPVEDTTEDDAASSET